MLSRILSTLPRWLAPAALALGLVACGGGGGSMSGTGGGPQGCSPSTCGNALLTLTDAAGDFASYTVDVTSLKLTKADGTVVETLPIKTRVDFAQLVNVTEFLTSATVPQGDYVSATMTLDYSNAQIFVYSDDTNTTTTQVATVVDDKGNTLYPGSPPASQIALTVQLDNSHHLVVSPGHLAHLALDFNLAASNTIPLPVTAPVTDTVKPFIVASVVKLDNKETRVRGTLVGGSVDTSGGTYTINVEPFDDEHEDRGQVIVHTTDQTTYEIDGTSYTGSAGLTALKAEADGTMTVAFGTLSETDHTFTASRVLAGTSVESTTFDRLHGVVTARTGDTLTVRGGSMWTHVDDEDQFSPSNVTLSIGDATVFTVDGDPTAMPTKLWPSVGSKITAFGKAGKDSSGNPTFDATAGRVRLELTSLWGTATQVGTGSVTLNLQAIEGNAPSAFNFAGTGGASPNHDSDPTAYVVNTGALPLTTVAASAPLRFIGLVQPFGSAQPDFNASTLVDFTDTAAQLAASFGSGSSAALTASTANLVLNVKDPLLGWMHFIKIGPQLIDLKTLASNVTIVPDPASAGPFAIRTSSGSMDGMDGDGGTVNVYNSFADFETQLASKLGTALVQNVLAVGHYDQTTNTFTATQIAVNLH